MELNPMENVYAVNLWSEDEFVEPQPKENEKHSEDLDLLSMIDAINPFVENFSEDELEINTVTEKGAKTEENEETQAVGGQLHSENAIPVQSILVRMPIPTNSEPIFPPVEKTTELNLQALLQHLGRVISEDDDSQPVTISKGRHEEQEDGLERHLRIKHKKIEKGVPDHLSRVKMKPKVAPTFPTTK